MEQSSFEHGQFLARHAITPPADAHPEVFRGYADEQGRMAARWLDTLPPDADADTVGGYRAERARIDALAARAASDGFSVPVITWGMRRAQPRHGWDHPAIWVAPGPLQEVWRHHDSRAEPYHHTAFTWSAGSAAGVVLLEVAPREGATPAGTIIFAMPEWRELLSQIARGGALTIYTSTPPLRGGHGQREVPSNGGWVIHPDPAPLFRILRNWPAVTELVSE